MRADRQTYRDVHRNTSHRSLGGEVASRETRRPASFSVRPDVIRADGSDAVVVAGRRVSVLTLARLVTLTYMQRFLETNSYSKRNLYNYIKRSKVSVTVGVASSVANDVTMKMTSQ